MENSLKINRKDALREIQEKLTMKSRLACLKFAVTRLFSFTRFCHLKINILSSREKNVLKANLLSCEIYHQNRFVANFLSLYFNFGR